MVKQSLLNIGIFAQKSNVFNELLQFNDHAPSLGHAPSLVNDHAPSLGLYAWPHTCIDPLIYEGRGHQWVTEETFLSLDDRQHNKPPLFHGGISYVPNTREVDRIGEIHPNVNLGL